MTPGLFDMHVHLREPGQEHKETVATGTASAVAGGFTAVACMPNTSPINDNAGVTEYILQKAAQANLARVYPIGAVSKGSNGEQLADIAELRAAGCVGISDDGRPVKTALLMRRALEYAGMFNMPVLEHCEDPSLKGEGVAHEGYHASTLGLRGIPGVAESIMVQRDIALAEMTGAAVHICHMSAATSLRAVREGKQHGARVTCEVAPHHFTLTDESLATPVSYDTNMKMNPPLRARGGPRRDAQGHRRRQRRCHCDRSRAASLRRKEDGVRPRARSASSGWRRACRSASIGWCIRASSGCRGSSSCCRRTPHAFSTFQRERSAKARSPTLRFSRRIWRSRSIPSTFRSKARNTPFGGWQLKGGVAATIVGGRTVYVNDAATGAESLSVVVPSTLTPEERLDALYASFNCVDSATDPIQLVRRFDESRRSRSRGILRRGAGVRACRERAAVDRAAVRGDGTVAGGVRASVRSAAAGARSEAARSPLDEGRRSHRARHHPSADAAERDRSRRFFSRATIPRRPMCPARSNRFRRERMADRSPRRRMATGSPVPASAYFFSRPSCGGACKRLNLFLRWMVRSDAVDFGIWKSVPAAKLVVPLDTHVIRVGRCLRLTRYTSPGWKMAADITASLRELDPADPVKYDFSLCHLGMADQCGFNRAQGDSRCPLRGLCHPRPRDARRRADGTRRASSRPSARR